MIKIKRLLKSFNYACRGFLKIFKEEQNLKVHVIAGLLAVFSGLYFKISRIEFALLAIVIGLVILMEIANSAVERIADILKPRLHVYVKEIKDISAAAVLVSSLLAVIAGILIFWPHIQSRLSQCGIMH